MCNGNGSTKSSALKVAGLTRLYAMEVFQPSQVPLSWFKKTIFYGSGSTTSLWKWFNQVKCPLVGSKGPYSMEVVQPSQAP
jgi:hypothetical protein